MGNVLTCTCNKRDINAKEFKNENNNKDDYGSTIMLNKNTTNDFIFSRGGNKNFGSKKDEILINVKIINLVKKIQNCYRNFKKQKVDNLKINKEENKFSSGYCTPLYQHNNEKVTHSHFQDKSNTFSFLGNRKNGMKEGFCIQYWKDGAHFKGIFTSNQANGIGKFFHSDGDDYSGHFKNDRAFGFGIYLHNNGARYIGEWVDDCQDGFGIEIWKDGSQFSGQYIKGKKHGMGCYKWVDGSKYEGNWEENCLNGFGVYHFADNKTYIGEWKDNMMHGYGEFHWKEGKKYAGYYFKDKKEGFGIYYWQSPNKAYIGFWNNGKQHGVGKYLTANKNRYGLWKDGERKNWFASESEALSCLEENQKGFKELFKYDLNEINIFLK